MDAQYIYGSETSSIVEFIAILCWLCRAWLNLEEMMCNATLADFFQW